MGRPKGSKNKKPLHLTPPPPKAKAQFANSKMAEQLYNEFRMGRGIYSYDALRAKYEKIFDREYFCLVDFDTAWMRLLNKVKANHGVDYHAKYANAVRARTGTRNRKPSTPQPAA